MNNSLCLCTRKKLYSLIPRYYIRFLLILCFTLSYTCYLLLLLDGTKNNISFSIYNWNDYGQFIAYLQHRRRLTAKTSRFNLQSKSALVQTLSNAWVSQFIDPRISGFVVIIIFAGLSFNISRLLLR